MSNALVVVRRCNNNDIQNSRQNSYISLTHTHAHQVPCTLKLRGLSLSTVQVFGVPFMETSAKSGLNVELAFTAVAK